MQTETIHCDTSVKELTPEEVNRARDFLVDLYGSSFNIETYSDEEVEEEIKSLMDIETFRTEDIYKMFF